jgi:hypothetical protein
MPRLPYPVPGNPQKGGEHYGPVYYCHFSQIKNDLYKYPHKKIKRKHQQRLKNQ